MQYVTKIGASIETPFPLIILVVADVADKCLLATVARGSQYLAARNVPQGVDGGEGSAGAVR